MDFMCNVSKNVHTQYMHTHTQKGRERERKRERDRGREEGEGEGERERERQRGTRRGMRTKVREIGMGKKNLQIGLSN